MPRLPKSGERGQLLPVWALGVITVLALTLFVVNYANVVRWQVRAQNAADSAAAASLAPIADGWNEIELEMYASTIEEMRIRYLNQAVLNTLAGDGCTPTGASATCATDYSRLVTQLNTAVNNYDNSVLFLSNVGAMLNDRFEDPSNGAFETLIGGVPAGSGLDDDTTCDKVRGGSGYDNYTGAWNGPGPQPTPGGSYPGWSSTGCVNQADPAFSFTPVDVDDGNAGYGTPNLSEVVSCKNVPIFEPKILGLSSAATFRAIGVSAFTISPILEVFNPGTAINPSTGNAYQPIESNYTIETNSFYTVDYSGLTVNVNFYLPVPTPSYKTFNPFVANTGTLYAPNGPEACS